MKLTSYILLVILGFLAFLVEPVLLPVLGVYLFFCYFFFPTKERKSWDFFLFVFVLVGIVSINNCRIYMDLYGNTRGPYYDDSLYYFNSIYLSQFTLSIHPPTLFEVVLAIPQFISSLLFDEPIKHVFLLPINWVFAAYSVVYVIKIKDLIIPSAKIGNWVLVAMIALNFNFIDTAAHLYRDVLMMFLVVLCWYNLIKTKYKLALLCIVLVFFIRGANGVLLGILVLFFYLLFQRSYSLKRTLMIFSLPIFILLISAPYINSSFFRGGFGNEESISLTQRINSRMEVNSVEDGSGSTMLRNGNILMKSVYPVVYTFSPFLANLIESEVGVRQADFNNMLGFSLGSFIFPAEYRIPISIHVFFVGLLWFPILSGLVAGLKSSNKKIVAFSLFMIVQILAISIISMQARHRLPMVYLFPVFYTLAYTEKRLNTKLNKIVSLVSFGLVVFFNLYMNL